MMLLDVLDLDLESSKPFRQKVVERGEDDEEKKSEDAHKDRAERVEESQLLHYRVVGEYHHANADRRIDETHQDIESREDFAGLEDGDADQLLFHLFRWDGQNAVLGSGLHDYKPRRPRIFHDLVGVDLEHDLGCNPCSLRNYSVAGVLGGCSAWLEVAELN